MSTNVIILYCNKSIYIYKSIPVKIGKNFFLFVFFFTIFTKAECIWLQKNKSIKSVLLWNIITIKRNVLYIKM